MKENGKMIYNMVLVKKNGQMDRFMKAITLKEWSTVKENIHGVIKVIMMESGLIIKLKGMVSIIGLMEEDI